MSIVNTLSLESNRQIKIMSQGSFYSNHISKSVPFEIPIFPTTNRLKRSFFYFEICIKNDIIF